MNINPIALQIGPVAIHWYGISYAVGLGLGIWILTLLNKRRKTFKDTNEIFDFAFWFFLGGVMLGGRLGYVLFYNLPYYIQNPGKTIAIWEGGMSFHGGLIAAVIVTLIFCRKRKIRFLDLADMAVIPSALALTFTRLANFVNRELIGRVIENPKLQWMGMDFGDGLLRYPSQLLQSANALILFLVLLFIFSRKPRRGILFFSYLAGYGLLRVIAELFRAPDVQVGFIWKYFTLGQLFSAAMLVTGVVGVVLVKAKKTD